MSFVSDGTWGDTLVEATIGSGVGCFQHGNEFPLFTMKGADGNEHSYRVVEVKNKMAASSVR